MKAIITCFVLLHLFAYTNAQQGKGHVKGKVTTSEGRPVKYANIAVAGTRKGASTNDEGRYIIKGIKAGTYKLVVSFIGLEKQEEQVEVKAGETTVQHFQLKENNRELKEIMISSKRNRYQSDYPSDELRLDMPLIETSQNIQVITESVIADQQINTMREGITRNVSGAQMIEHWGNFARVNMRGFRLPAFRNGINYGLTWGPLSEDMSVVERIEFVKGPAGFMLSSGEPGGFYNVVTKKPGLHHQNQVGLTVGSYNRVRSTVDLGGKLDKEGKLLYRFNAMGMMSESHRDYEFSDRYTIAPSLKYRFDENTSVTAEYIYQKAIMSNLGGPYVFARNEFREIPRNVSLLEPNMEPTHIDEHNIFLHFNHKINENWKLTAKASYLNYKQIGSSLWPESVDSNDVITRGVDIFDALNESQFGQVFLNGDFETGFVSHKILTGIDMGNKQSFYDWTQGGELKGGDFDIHNPQHGVPTDSFPEFDRSRDIRKRAGAARRYGHQYTSAYFQDQLGFMDNRIRLTLAGRYTNNKRTSYGSSVEDEVFSPRAGLSVTVIENTSAYAMYDQAFLPQTGVDAEGNAFEPVRANDIEAGIKRDWNNGKWNTTFSVYNITKQNVLTADPENPNFSIQLGEVRSRGAEFDLRGEVYKGFNIVFNYAYTNVLVTEDTDPEKEGDRVAGHARHMSNSWISYDFQNPVLKGFGLSIGHQYQADRSSWNWSAENETVLPDYLRLDGAVSWSSNNLELSLNVNNILDEYLYSGASYANYVYWQVEPGRNFRLNMNYNF